MINYCACSKSGPGFPTSYVVVLLCSVRWLFILVIIGRIIDHHCLNFLEIIRFFSVVHVALSLGLCVVFCRSLFTLLSYFCWPLFCLSFNLRILITPLVFSNSSNFSPSIKNQKHTWICFNHLLCSYSWSLSSGKSKVQCLRILHYSENEFVHFKIAQYKCHVIENV